MTEADWRWSRAFNRPAVLRQRIREVFARQHIACTSEQLDKLIRVLRAFVETLPSFEHVRKRALSAGPALTDEEVTQVCWALRAAIKLAQGPPEHD
jgi:hypothetical protein